MGDKHVQGGLGDRVLRVHIETRVKDHVGVGKSGGEGDDLLRGAFAKKREEDVDRVRDAGDVGAELRQ